MGWIWELFGFLGIGLDCGGFAVFLNGVIVHFKSSGDGIILSL